MYFKVEEARPSQKEWLCERVGLQPTSALTAIAATDSSGQTRGVVGYDRWSGGHGSVEMHLAMDHPAALLALLGPGLRYPFEQQGIQVVYGVVSDVNEQVKKFLCTMGWTMTHRIRDGWTKGIDNLLFELRKDDWIHMLRDRRMGALLRAHENRYWERRVA